MISSHILVLLCKYMFFCIFSKNKGENNVYNQGGDMYMRKCKDEYVYDTNHIFRPSAVGFSLLSRVCSHIWRFDKQIQEYPSRT